MGSKVPKYDDILKFANCLASYETRTAGDTAGRQSYDTILSLIRKTARPGTNSDAVRDFATQHKGTAGTVAGAGVSVGYAAATGSLGAATAGNIASQAASAVTYAPTTVMAIAPLGMVFSVWMGAAQVASLAGTVGTLYDLKNDRWHYGCKCGNCKTNIGYFAEKGDFKAAKIAVSIFLPPVGIALQINSIRKHFEANRPSEVHSKGIVQSARGRCPLAIGTIFFAVCDSFFASSDFQANACKVLAIIISSDGWKELKSLIT